MHAASNPHIPRFQFPRSPFPISVSCDTVTHLSEPGPRQPRFIVVLYSPHMAKDTKDILEAVNFIKDHMVTKTEFNEAVDKIENRLTAVENKIAGIHNRIDDEALKRANLENRVRSIAPNLPPPPERV
jgi:hypothetical protein